MPIFQKNIQVLADIDATLCEKISLIESNVLYEVFTDNDPVNINFLDNRTQTPVYLENAAEETIAQFQKYDQYSYYPYLYFFGLGNGIIYKALLENQRLKKLIVFEPELEMIYIVLNLVDFSEELRNGRLLILFTEDVTLDVMTREMEEAKLFIKTYDLHQPLPYYDYAHEEMIRINKITLRAMHYILYALGNDPKDSVEGVENFISNLPDMVRSPKLTDTLKAIKNTKTAIIVSTGPSLSKQLSLLKEITPYVTIICIDASFPILYKHGIKPDVVVSLERVIATSAFYKSVPDDFQKDVVFFISALAHKGLIHSLKQGAVQLSMRHFGYMSYFGLDEWGYIGIGASAANMAFEIAYHAKFDNVVFIGQDLAYAPDGKSHSQNHIFGENEINTSREYIQIEGYGGGHTVATTTAWKSFLDFFERNIPLVNTQINVINATEGGARIYGTVEKPFSEVAKEILATEPLKLPIAVCAPDKKEVIKNTKKIEQKITDFLAYGEKVQKEIETVFLNVVEYLKSFENLSNQEALVKANLATLQLMTSHIDSIKAYLDDSMFTQLFHESYKSVTLQQEIENGPIRVMPEDTEEQQKEKNLLWVKAHKQWLFFLAGAIHGTLHSIERGKSSWDERQYFVSNVILQNNYLSGYLYDLYSPSENQTVELCIDGQPIMETIASRPQSGLQILDEEDRHHGFLIELPVELFDEKSHTLILRESVSKQVLKNGYAKFQWGEADKIQGSVQSRNHVLYSGWCKKVGSNEKQMIDIYIDDQYVDTVIADRYIPTFKYLHGDEKFGFEFIVPEVYFDDQEHIIRFASVGNSLALTEDKDEFVLGEADLGKQREAMFIHSLDNVDPEKIKDLYCPNAIGFLATEENLEDEEFVRYIKELMVRFPQVEFKALGFNQHLRSTVEKTLGIDFLEYVEIKNIHEIFENIEVYLSNYERTYSNFVENGIIRILRTFSTDVVWIGLGLNRQHISVRQHEINNPSYFGKIFDHLEYLGFTEGDIARYGKSYNEVYFKKASETYGVDIGFNLDETVSKAYVNWNLKLGLKHHEFFQYSLEFGRKYAGLQQNG